MSVDVPDLEGLPGSEIVIPGLADLKLGRDTIDAASVQVASQRLRSAGLEVPRRTDEDDGEPGHRVFRLLVESGTADPYSRYNAILRRIASFAGALEGARPR